MELYNITTSIVLMMVLLEFRVSAFDMKRYLKYEKLISRIPPGYMPTFGRKFKDNKMGENCYTVNGKSNVPEIEVKTVEECVLYCWLKLRPVGLIKFGRSCMCTDYRSIKKTKSVMCHRRCKDNMRQNCGGEKGFAGYFTGYAWYPLKGIETPGVRYDANRYIKGCYAKPQRIGHRIKFGTLRMTVSLCCTSCFKFYKYKYAALQDGAYCICWNDWTNMEKIDKAWVCARIKCVGNIKETCGGTTLETRVYKEEDKVYVAGKSSYSLPRESTFLSPYIRPKGCYDSFDGTKDRVNKDPVCNPKALPVDVAQKRQRIEVGLRPLPPPKPMVMNPNPVRIPGPNGKQTDHGPDIGMDIGLTLNATGVDMGPLTDEKIYGISGGVIGVLILVYCCCRSSKKADEEQKEKDEKDKEDREERRRKKKEKKEKKKREQEEAANQFYQEENYYY